MSQSSIVPHWEINDSAACLAAYRAIPVLPKAEVAKLQPGTWIEVKWLDGPNEALLLTRRMERAPGEITLNYYIPGTRSLGWHATNRQVVRVLGPLQVPAVAGSAVPQ